MDADKIIEETDVISGEFDQDDGPSLRETLSAKWDEIHEGEETSSEAEPSEDRDERGRFKAKSQQPENSGKGETTEAETTLVTESAVSEPPVPAPSSWAADAKELFNQLPPRLQQEVVRRETDLRRHLTQETEKLSQRARTYAEIDEALAPRMNELSRAGVSPGQVVSRFMAWQQHLDTDPAQGLRDLAQSYGLDLRQLAEEQPEQQQEPAYVRELRGQVQQMQGLLQQTVQKTEQEKQAEKARAIQNDLAAFAGETDSTGNKLRPHIEQVAEDMVPYINHIRANNPELSPRQVLQVAYEKAIWANPSTRELELKKTQTPMQPTKQVERAKRATRLVDGEAVGSSRPETPNNVRSAIEAAWDKIHG